MRPTEPAMVMRPISVPEGKWSKQSVNKEGSEAKQAGLVRECTLRLRAEDGGERGENDGLYNRRAEGEHKGAAAHELRNSKHVLVMVHNKERNTHDTRHTAEQAGERDDARTRRRT